MARTVNPFQHPMGLRDCPRMRIGFDNKFASIRRNHRKIVHPSNRPIRLRCKSILPCRYVESLFFLSILFANILPHTRIVRIIFDSSCCPIFYSKTVIRFRYEQLTVCLRLLGRMFGNSPISCVLSGLVSFYRRPGPFATKELGTWLFVSFGQNPTDVFRPACSPSHSTILKYSLPNHP